MTSITSSPPIPSESIPLQSTTDQWPEDRIRLTMLLANSLLRFPYDHCAVLYDKSNQPRIELHYSPPHKFGNAFIELLSKIIFKEDSKPRAEMGTIVFNADQTRQMLEKFNELLNEAK